MTNGSTTLLKTRTSIMIGRRIRPKLARILTTQKKTTIPKRNLTVLPAALLPQNSDIRIQRIKRFINIVLTSPQVKNFFSCDILSILVGMS